MAARLAAVAHVFVAELGDLGGIDLTDDDRHHLERVLRLRVGELVTASDGAGAWRQCRWAGAGLEPDGEVEHEARADPAITVAFAVPKGDRPEWIVQKLTEVGVNHIQPLMTARSVVRWDGDRATKQVARLRRVAREAAMQSRQVWLPVVEAVAPLPVALAAMGDLAALAHPGGDPPSLDRPTVMIGPEGGWTAGELDGRPLVGLGPTVLRAETAAVSVGILLAGLRAGIVLQSR